MAAVTSSQVVALPSSSAAKWSGGSSRGQAPSSRSVGVARDLRSIDRDRADLRRPAAGTRREDLTRHARERVLATTDEARRSADRPTYATASPANRNRQRSVDSRL